MNESTKEMSPWAAFGATCMYFGAEIIDAMEAAGLETDVPIGVIQSAIGGSQIESWMSNETLLLCKNQSLTGGAVPQNSGRLYYGMICPMANYSVAGWVWYQVRPLVSLADHNQFDCDLRCRGRTTYTETWATA